MKQSNEYKAISRLSSRYKLIEGAHTTFNVNDEFVQLVSNADDLLKTSQLGQAFGNLTAAAGTFVTFLTVPAGKIWTLKAINRGSSVASTKCLIQRGTIEYSFSSTLGTTNTSVDNLNLKLGAGDKIGMFTSGSGSDGSVGMQVFYEEEDVY